MPHTPALKNAARGLPDLARKRPHPAAWLATIAVLVMASAAAALPTLVLTITEDGSQAPEEWQAFDAYPVKLYDFDGDGRREVVDHNDNNHVYVLHSGTGALLADLGTTFPQYWEARSINGVEAERMEPGSQPSLIVTNSAAYVTRFDFDPAQSNATHFEFTKRWETRMDTYDANPGADDKPVLGDADQDGTFEIFAQVEDHGHFALNADGGIRWSKNLSGGNAEPVISDGDRDGHLEAYFFSDDGMVRVHHATDGKTEWTYDAKQQITWPASIPRGGTVANLDLNGRREVIFCARDAHDAEDFSNDHMGLYVIRNDDMDAWGNLVWFRQPSWAAPLCYARPVVYDGNNAGRPEVYGMDWNTIGHNPGNWERTGPAHLFRFSWNGHELWNVTLDTWWSNKDIALADLDGDGKTDILASGPNADGHDGWWIIGADNGTRGAFVDVDPYKSSRSPRLADLEGDGVLDFVIPVEGNNPPTNPGEGAFQVWNAHTSNTTLVWSGGEDAYEKPGAFSGGFTPHNSSNPWYVKVKVSTFHKVVQAWYAVDGGEWKDLNLLSSGASWTYWDKAVPQIPDGAAVSFRAEDDLGKSLTSKAFAWPPS